jgi:hypothetical protein
MQKILVRSFRRRIEREVMKIYEIIVEDDNGKLYRLDSAWCNENFNYNPEHDKIELIK